VMVPFWSTTNRMRAASSSPVMPRKVALGAVRGLARAQRTSRRLAHVAEHYARQHDSSSRPNG
jgi:hypothetical protein